MTIAPPVQVEGRVLGLTRVGIWVLLVLAAANGVFLYVLPGLADTDYAWSIKPPVNAMFIGAGFLAGTLATGLVLAAATRWRSFSTLPPALWVLATSLLAATIIHADRFRWDYPLTWVWALVYGGVPIAVPLLVARQRRVAEPEPPADPRLRLIRVLSLVIGAPLLTCAAGLRRPAEALIPFATLAAWSLLLLALPLLRPDDLSDAGAWIALMLGLLALSALALHVAVPDRARL